jgi:hypothetical protein
VVEAPAALHAADGVGGAGDSGEDGENEERSGVDCWESRDHDGSDKA